MKDQTYIKRVCKNILQDDFDWRKYLNPKTYYGRELCTMPLFCSYGQIGFTIYFPYQELPQITYDWEMNRLTIDEVEYEEWLSAA